jgi:hypothetical protein
MTWIKPAIGSELKKLATIYKEHFGIESDKTIYLQFSTLISEENTIFMRALNFDHTLKIAKLNVDGTVDSFLRDRLNQPINILMLIDCILADEDLTFLKIVASERIGRSVAALNKASRIFTSFK